MALAVKFSEDGFNFRISKTTLKTASTATLLSSSAAELKKVMFRFCLVLWQRLSLRDNLRDKPFLCGQTGSDSPSPWRGCGGPGVGHLGPGPRCGTQYWGALVRHRHWPSGLQPQNDLPAGPSRCSPQCLRNFQADLARLRVPTNGELWV